MKKLIYSFEQSNMGGNADVVGLNSTQALNQNSVNETFQQNSPLNMTQQSMSPREEKRQSKSLLLNNSSQQKTNGTLLPDLMNNSSL